MSVECVNQLGFHRPLTSLVKESLIVRNPNNRPLAFKIKTTAPKQYCVRPNSGRIEPGQEVEVQVLLQAMKDEPPQDVKCRDKFLVQSTTISADHESSSISTLWNEVESKNRDDIHEKKIRCVFLPFEDHLQASNSPPETHDGVATPAYHAAEFDNADNEVSGTINNARDAPALFKASVPQQFTTQPQRSSEEPLLTKLNSANDEIEQLKRQLESANGSRKRLEKPSHNEGVPVPLTALIALIAFLAAYLLF